MNKRGFTLIELLVVVAIVVIVIFSIIIPMFQNSGSISVRDSRDDKWVSYDLRFKVKFKRETNFDERRFKEGLKKVVEEYVDSQLR
ncbi:MAG: prepilin-type N-terminal cleavage/methylation domain-containing protein [archaeon]